MKNLSDDTQKAESKVRVSDGWRDEDYDAGQFRKSVCDKLSRINIYFAKENHENPMYKNTWDSPLVMVQVDHLLWDVMDALHIDPTAKSY